MNRSAFIVLSLVGAPAMAIDYETTNSMEQRIVVRANRAGQDVIEVSGKGIEGTKVYLVADECPKWEPRRESLQKEFSCKSDGRSPLAGARFRFKPAYRNWTGCPKIEPAYTCILGCGPGKVPNYLYIRRAAPNAKAPGC